MVTTYAYARVYSCRCVKCILSRGRRFPHPLRRTFVACLSHLTWLKIAAARIISGFSMLQDFLGCVAKTVFMEMIAPSENFTAVFAFVMSCAGAMLVSSDFATENANILLSVLRCCCGTPQVVSSYCWPFHPHDGACTVRCRLITGAGRLLGPEGNIFARSCAIVERPCAACWVPLGIQTAVSRPLSRFSCFFSMRVHFVCIDPFAGIAAIDVPPVSWFCAVVVDLLVIHSAIDNHLNYVPICGPAGIQELRLGASGRR